MKKTLASIFAMLAFVATTQAQDMRQGDDASMKAEPTGQTSATAPASVRGTVARAAITNAIEDREPVDNLAKVTTETDQVYYFTELRDMEGQSVTHRWEHDGETMAEVEFQVGGSRWRVYSSKNLMPEWVGQWKVSVINDAGNTVRADAFMYTEAPAMGSVSSEMSQDTMTGDADMKAEKPVGR